MSQAIVDPEQLRRFAQNLKRFNSELQSQVMTLHGQMKNLSQTWRDKEQQKFNEEFEQTMLRYLEIRRSRSTHTCRSCCGRRIAPKSIYGNAETTMRPGAHVKSIEALEGFRAALCVFGDEVEQSLATIQSEVQDSSSWLEDDQIKFWRDGDSTAREQGCRSQDRFAPLPVGHDRSASHAVLPSGEKGARPCQEEAARGRSKAGHGAPLDSDRPAGGHGIPHEGRAVAYCRGRRPAGGERFPRRVGEPAHGVFEYCAAKRHGRDGQRRCGRRRERVRQVALPADERAGTPRDLAESPDATATDGTSGAEAASTPGPPREKRT